MKIIIGGKEYHLTDETKNVTDIQAFDENSENITEIVLRIPEDNYTVELVTTTDNIIDSGLVDWGDGLKDNLYNSTSHVYEKAGDYTVKGFFLFGGGYSPSTSMRNTLIKIKELSNKHTSLASAFKFCSNLRSIRPGIKLTNLTSLRYTFDHSGIARLDVSNWDVSNVTDMNHTFLQCEYLTEIKGLDKWDVSNVTDMEGLFHDGRQLVLNLYDLRNWDVSNVTDMDDLFSCILKNTQGIKNWDVSNVTSMRYMFDDCNIADDELDLSNWDVSNVTSMVSMFRDCDCNKLNLSNWDVSNVTNMASMFSTKWSESNTTITEIKGLDTWDVSNVTTMREMFYKCRYLKSIGDISKWNTQSLTNTRDMFAGCSNLSNLDLSNWNTQNLDDAYGMFTGCGYNNPVHWTLDLSKWNTSNLSDIRNMFYNCTYLTSIDLTGWDINKIDTFEALFNNCSMLREIKGLDTWDVSKVNSMMYMFFMCSNLLSINLSGWNTQNLKYTSSMFADCTVLNSVDLTGWKTESITSMNNMFSGCEYLEEVKGIENWGMSTYFTSMNSMFYACSSLKKLDLSNWNIVNVNDIQSMFEFSEGLSYLNLSNWNLSNVTDINNVLHGNDTLKHVVMNNCTVDSINEIITRLPTRSESDRGLLSVGTLDPTTVDIATANSKYWDVDYHIVAQYKFNKSSSGDTMNTIPEFNSGFEYIEMEEYEIVDGVEDTMNNVTKKIISNQSPTSMKFNSKPQLLEIQKLDTSKLTDMDNFIKSCKNLTSLDLSGYDTRNVTSMYNFISDCTNLTIVDVSGLDTSNVTSFNGLFDGCTKLETIVGLEDWDTSNVTTFNNLFNGCESLTSLDGIVNWNTSKVTNFKSSFNKCKAITQLDLSNWDVSNGTDFYYMFYYCNGLELLDLTGFDISNNIGNTSDMLSNTNNLKTIILMNMKTEHINTFISLLNKRTDNDRGDIVTCKPEGTLDVATAESKFWNIKPALCRLKINGPVTSYIPDFYQNLQVVTEVTTEYPDEDNLIPCPSIECLKYVQDDGTIIPIDFILDKNCEYSFDKDLGMYDHEYVPIYYATLPTGSKLLVAAGLYEMLMIIKNDENKDIKERIQITLPYTDTLYDIDDLEFIDVVNTDHFTRIIINDENIKYMVATGLYTETARVFGIDYLDATNLTFLTSSFASLEELIYAKNIENTENVVDMGSMFCDCVNLTDVDMSKVNLQKVATVNNMFRACESLTNIKGIEDWDVSNVLYFDDMFNICWSLSELDLSKWNTNNARSFSNMFYDCALLKDIKWVENWDTSFTAFMKGMFNGCIGLTSLNLSNWNTSNLMSMEKLFYNCVNLKDITGLTNWDTSKCNDFGSVFYKCSSLEHIDVSGWNFTNLKDYGNYMFSYCTNLKTINASSWDLRFKNVEKLNIAGIFTNCENLERINFDDVKTDDHVIFYSSANMLNPNIKTVSIRNCNNNLYYVLLYMLWDALDKVEIIR